MNKRKAMGTILIVIGLGILITAVSMKLWGYYKQKNMVDAFQKTIENIDKTSETTTTNSTKEPLIDDSVLGIVTIPKINLSVALGEDVDSKILKYAVGHFKGTALPGSIGNCCIAGHRSYTYSEYFNRLDELKTGDEINIKTKSGTYTYVVYDTFVVKPTQTEVLNPSKDAELTLITCTPIRIATHRLIVKARMK